MSLIADAEEKIFALQARVNAATNIAALISKKAPKTVNEPVFDINSFFIILRSSLADVHAEAEAEVKLHVQKLGKKGAEDWLSQGRQFDDGKTCPFCAQSTKDNSLIRAYQTHFNEAYIKLKANVDSLQKAITDGTASGIVDLFAQGVATARAHAASWQGEVQTDSIDFEEVPVRSALIAFHDFLTELVVRKRASPTDAIGSNEDAYKARILWNAILKPMQATNGSIVSAGASIDAFKGKLGTDDLRQLNAQIQQIEASKRRHSPIVGNLLAQHATARQNANAADSKKKAARTTLDSLMTTTLDSYQTSINTLLKDCGASFSIRQMGANFKGAAPRTEYGRYPCAGRMLPWMEDHHRFQQH